MSAINKIFFVLGVVLWLSWTGMTYAQDSAIPVQVKLSLADSKTIYRIGEPVKLVLEFTADSDGYQVDTIPDRSEHAYDAISVSPDGGAYHWLAEYLGGRRSQRCVVSYAKLSTSPTRMEFLLNDSIRFDRPGKYSIQVTTRRVLPTSSRPGPYTPVVLTTNEVMFEVQPMSVADEEKAVKRLSDLLDASHEWQAEERLTEELSFLTGDASSREKVRRFLNAEGRSGNYGQHIHFGLFIARNRALVLQLLEAALRDPKTPVTPALLSALTKLRTLHDGSGMALKATTTVAALAPFEEQRFKETQEAYVAELAAGLAKRVGKSQTTTAMTILMNLPAEPQIAGVMLAEVRRLLLQQFDSLHAYDQDYLLRVYWDQLRAPSLASSLEKMLGYTGSSSKNIHDSALKRLLELAPDEARPYVISEIRDPTSLVELEILGSLSDKFLPEVDDALLDQIRRFASAKENFDSVYLKQKTSLAARYGTNGIYGDLMQIYRSTLDKLPLEPRAALLAYFTRHNEQEALPLIEQTLGELQPGQDFNVLPDLTRLYYSDGIDALLVRRLEMDEPQTASTAAYLISLHGPASDREVLERRLERWRKEWAQRVPEADASMQGMIERELITALTRAKAWKLPPGQIKELQRSCITQLCRQTFP